jgi:hypothetical protein
VVAGAVNAERRNMKEKVKYPYPGATNAEAYEWLNQCTDPERKVQALRHE